MTAGLWSLDDSIFVDSRERRPIETGSLNFELPKHLVRTAAHDQRMTEADIKLLLIDSFHIDGFSAIPEVRHDPWNDDQTATRRIDLLGVQWRGLPERRLVSVEIKTSRSDFLNDIKRPEKQAPWISSSTEHWYAAPSGVVDVGLLPEGSGLLEVTRWSYPHRDDRPDYLGIDITRRANRKAAREVPSWLLQELLSRSHSAGRRTVVARLEAEQESSRRSGASLG